MDSFLLSVDALRRRGGAKWRLHPDDVLPAWVADMDFKVAEPVQRAIVREVEQHNYVYAPMDDKRLELAFAEHMRDRFAWEPATERMVRASDLLQAIVAILLALTRPGDGVVLQTPIYPPFLSVIEATKRRRVDNPLLDDGSRFVLDAPGLERAVDSETRVLLICNPHNPTGRVFEQEELEAIGRLAVERDLVIVSDEIHCDLVYPGRRHLPMGTLGEEVAARTITLNSATKGFNIAGLRTSLMHFGSQDLFDRFKEALPERLLGTVAVTGVEATVASWREGQPWLDEVMETLRANRDRVAAWVAEVAPGIRHHSPEATYLAWLDCRGLNLPGPGPYDFFLEKARVGLSKGSDFSSLGDTCVRLNFATAPDILEQVLERMGNALRGLG